MTRQAETNVICHDCEKELICPKCNKPQKSGTKFSLWLREQDEIASELGYTTTDIDFLWTNYKENWFIIIEEKIKGSTKSPYAQSEIYRKLDDLLQKSFRYKGYYKIVFQNQSPDDSQWIEINGKTYYGKETLIRLLKTGSVQTEFEW